MSLQPIVCPPSAFNIDQQPEAFFKSKFCLVGDFKLFFQGGSKTPEAERAELVKQWLRKHSWSPQW
jgi:hypothetical protein